MSVAGRAAVLGVALAVLTGASGAESGSGTEAGQAAQQKKTLPQLQAQIHRTTADLIEAKAAEEPDQAKIAELTESIRTLQSQVDTAKAATSDPAPTRGRFGWGRGRGGGRGQGYRGGRGQGGGRGGQGADPAFQQDRDWFHFLLDHRSEIRRTINKRDDGIETTTESNDPEIASVIQKHVDSMHERIKQGRPIHMRDPLFAAIFGNTEKITMKVERTEKGVRVVETSADPYVARLIQAHAEVVSLFLANGQEEVRKNHAVPE